MIYQYKSTFYSFYYYSKLIRYSLINFKNNDSIKSMEFLSKLCIDDIKKIFYSQNCSSLAYVPSFDKLHMQLFAENISKILKIKLWYGITKFKNIKSLCECENYGERYSVINDAFQITTNSAPYRILLLDNIITSGATLTVLTNLLEKHNIHVVRYVIACAHKTNTNKKQ